MLLELKNNFVLLVYIYMYIYINILLLYTYITHKQEL